MRSSRRPLVGASLLALISAQAAAGPCTVAPSGESVTCTGSPDLPIIYNDISSLTISNLDGNLAPAAGQAVATLTNQSETGVQGLSTALSFDDATHGFATSGASGIIATTTGGQGAVAPFQSQQLVGGDGGDGGVGSLTVQANAVSASGGGSTAIGFFGVGGEGGKGNYQPGSINSDSIVGGAAGAGGGYDGYDPALSVNVQVDTVTLSGGASGLVVSVNGGDGGGFDSNDQTIGQDTVSGSAGGAGGSGGQIEAWLSVGSVDLQGAAGAAVQLTSQGGAGGNAGTAVSQADFGQGPATGGTGGAGGTAQSVELHRSVGMSGSAQSGFIGVLAESIGGNGGTGGAVSGNDDSRGGTGGAGGNGGAVTIGTSDVDGAFVLSADLSGDSARAFVARSYGGIGGDGGVTQNSYGKKGQGGASLGGGDAGDVTAFVTVTAATNGQSADALLFQSVGGFSGSGSAESFGAGAQSHGNGGAVSVVATLTAGVGGYGISTAGATSDGLAVQSVGGGGGKALQDLGLTGLGGANLAGGNGGAVSLQASGAGIATSGSFSRGIYVDSVGGGGGSGGPSTSISAIGATGGTGGNGGDVTVTSAVTITTAGKNSDGLFAASRGGGGGSAMSAVNLFSVGGQAGGGGGNGGTVSLGFSNGITTSGDDSDAVFAQSVGGGGGDGANAVATGIAYLQAVGGTGGTGGDGGAVSVVQSATASGTVATTGHRSRGVVAQSVGGGGGTGGSAVAAGALGGYSHTVGGTGGTGGSAGTVTVTTTQGISTQGKGSDGILAQSLGGGGGSASSVVNADILGAISVSNSVGGSGGSGGDAAGVSVSAGGAISTNGTAASGIVAQATGGGGGHSGIMVSNSSLSVVTVGVAIGGSGGDGGNVTGNVSVAATGAISTAGDSAQGVLAHSLGGGGGYGSTTINTVAATVGNVTVDVGGAGGKAGAASDVSVTTSGAITTKGSLSDAVAAVSTGGGGGTGGTVLTAGTLNVGAIGVSIGGKGGGGGKAGNVTVATSGDIATGGHLSDGILASSVGGKGGMSAAHIVGTANANSLTVASVDVTLGGKGGSGGQAGNVNVNTSNSIQTQGHLSAGILAQSLGGDGGRARGAVTADIGQLGNVAVTIGGSGGDGGLAGTVDVITALADSTIETSGFLSHGILAQSVGGSGGAGGFAGEVALDFGTDLTEGVSGEVGVTIGGGGASGGRSSDVTVQNVSSISTGDLASIGILAQSIGGNGGDGGSVYAFNTDISAPSSVNVNFNIGGDGGFGAESAAVDVTNSGAINTSSFLSAGILAQSVGGNGGNGGSSYTALLQAASSSTVQITAQVGGAGGGGGNAQQVSVQNQGAIFTAAGGSDGIIAQSVGGGGGRGGNAGYIAVNISNPVQQEQTTQSFSLNFSVGGGGSGGEGANANAVTVKNDGAITTTGTRSRGIMAQSVGGGGGDGGTASSTSFAVSDICNNTALNTYVCGDDPTKNAVTDFAINSTVVIGGQGSTGGSGGGVTVENTADITTSGQLSHGIYAQSVGGGGGNGGEGALGIEAWTTNQLAVKITDLPGNLLPSFSSFDIVVGGAGGSGGDGGSVTVTNSGNIQINGPDASYIAKYTGLLGGVTNALPFLAGGSGIFAQSVGGGGGDGGAGSSSLTAAVTVGSKGGGGGTGGAVSVTSTGTITNTSGFSGTGIFAQSVGGGGGTAGDVGQGFSDSGEYLNIGAGVAVSESPGAGGDGGEVTVTASNTIHTTGIASPGIVAQSVGGSGGIAAVKSNSTTTIYAGSGNAPGNGGNVTVNANAAILVEGQGSVGIVALSAGGSASDDVSGTVTVNVSGAIEATGQDGRGILASSDAQIGQSSGNVLINVNEGASVLTGASGGEAIYVLDGGGSSVITNSGTIGTQNAASYALRVAASNPFLIDNYGTATGSILTEAKTDGGAVGSFTFNNYGLMNSGTAVTIGGVNSSFWSGGTIAPGGAAAIATTTISSGFEIELYGTSTYMADFDPSRPLGNTVVASDLMSLVAGTFDGTGLVAVAGTISPNLILSQPGSAQRTGTAYILNSNYAFDTSLLTVADTATVDYSLSTSDAVTADTTTLVLSYAIDTTPWDDPSGGNADVGAWNGVNANHRSFGAYLDKIIFDAPSGADGAFVTSLAEQVLNLTGKDDLMGTYDGFIADQAFAVPDATMISSLSFSDELHSCARRTDAGSFDFGQEGQCSWVRLYGRDLERNPHGSGPNYSETVTGLSMGAQFELSADTWLGLAADYESGVLSFDQGSGTVSRTMAGAVLKQDLGGLMLAASIEGGTFSSTQERWFDAGSDLVTATSDPDGNYLSAHVRANQRFSFGSTFIDPTIDFGATRIHQNGYSEQGAGGYGMAVSDLEQTVYSVNPFVNFGRAIDLNGMAGQTLFRAGMLGLFGDTPAVQASFLGAGSDGPTFLMQDDPVSLFADFGASLDLAVSDRMTIRGAIDALLSDEEVSYQARVRLNYAF